MVIVALEPRNHVVFTARRRGLARRPVAGLSALEDAPGRHRRDPAGYAGGRRPWLAARRDCTSDEASFYRLSSLRPWPDRRLGKRGLEIVARRAPRGDEFDIMTDATVVLQVVDASTDRQRGCEMALDRGALTAFLSWSGIAAVSTGAPSGSV